MLLKFFMVKIKLFLSKVNTLSIVLYSPGNFCSNCLEVSRIKKEDDFSLKKFNSFGS